MKIVCDNCATKYQIADEKVSGKAFKIRCKKCGHVIVVNKGPGEGASQAPAAESSVNQEAPPPAAEAAAPSDAVWHLVIDREQVGPMTPDEVKGKVRGGQADAETYGWREGFDDWLKLSAIEDFKALFPAGNDDQATRRTDSAGKGGAATAGASPGADLFSGINRDEPVRTAAPGAATIVSDGMHAPDLAALGLAAPVQAPMAAAAPSAASPVHAPAPMSASAGGGGGGAGLDAPVKSMTGARSENSVLFSLNNLSALAGASGGGGGGGGGKSASAMGGGGGGGGSMPSPQSEASGLIDIRAMAAAHLGPSAGGPSPSSRMPDLLGGADAPPVFTPLAPAVLMPTSEPSGVPKWVFALVGVGVLMFIGMIVTLVLVLREPSQQPVVNNNPGKDPGQSGTTSTTPDKPSTPDKPNIVKEPGTSPGTKPEVKDTAKPDKPSSPDKGEKKGSSSGSKKDKESKPAKETKETKPDKGPDISTPTKTETPPPKKEVKPKAKDDLDSLLDNASSGSGGKPKKEDKKDLPEQASMSAIQGVLKKIDVSSCKGEGAAGTIMMKISIKGSGKADASGSSPGADCVAKLVKKASFPEFSGDPMSVNWPFIVR